MVVPVAAQGPAELTVVVSTNETTYCCSDNFTVTATIEEIGSQKRSRRGELSWDHIKLAVIGRVAVIIDGIGLKPHRYDAQI